MQKNRVHRWGHSPNQSQTDLFKSLLSKQLKLIKLGKLELYAPMLAIMERIVSQQRGDTNKVYSLDEPSVSCIAKGKVHKQYEFGSKVSVASWSGSNVVVGVTNFAGNPHDSKTLAPTLDQVAHWTGQCYARVLVDRGYRSHGQVGNTTVIMPGKQAHESAYALRKHKTLCQRRSAIEAIIGHLKREHRLGRNYLKGRVGDTNNALLAGMGFNLMLLLRELAGYFFVLLFSALALLVLPRQEYVLTADVLNTTSGLLRLDYVIPVSEVEEGFTLSGDNSCRK